MIAPRFAARASSDGTADGPELGKPRNYFDRGRGSRFVLPQFLNGDSADPGPAGAGAGQARRAKTSLTGRESSIASERTPLRNKRSAEVSIKISSGLAVPLPEG